VTELVTGSDQTPDLGEATSNNSGVIAFGPSEAQLARARDSGEPTSGPEATATADTDSDALRAFYGAAGRAGGAFRTALAGPAAWPVVTRRHPSVLEVFRHGQDTRAWHSPSLLVSVPVRVFWRLDSCWETACMIARVWWRTRITLAITVIAVVAFLVWRH
jgi:hypothetical protein